MTQVYSDPNREQEPTALPDVGVFWIDRHDDGFDGLEEGWYYWYCFPGCLPDSNPIGPFNTERQAIEAAQNQD